jgi:aldehyde:ferredoxin oxidoreductase
MKPSAIQVAKATPGYGYMNRILRIDLSAMTAHAHDSSRYLPEFLGGRGLAAKIVWDEYPEPVDPFEPANPLMIFPGALTGTRSPYNGRTSVCSFSPQALPHNWFTRSNIGGWIGGNIKRAGYDGIIVTGKTDTPARILVVDDEVSILPADDLWGVDALDSLDELERLEGKKTRSLVIGPAGEHLNRIATIQTGSSSACGQGGFGAVMGSKNLKAISVRGTYKVRAAHPDAIRHLAQQVGKAAITPPWLVGMLGKEPKELNEELASAGDGKVRYRACTEGCMTPCYPELHDMPGSVHQRKWSGAWPCVAGAFLGRNRPSAKNGIDKCPDDSVKTGWNYSLDRRAAFEMNVLTNRYGLNQFEILMGMVPWLNVCQEAGLISELNGIAMDWSSPEFWDAFLHAVTYREGMGDALAEGTCRAAQLLDLGKDLFQRFYPGWGQAGHWDGHMSSSFPFPFWIPSAIQWLADTRDPFNAGHGSKRFINIFSKAMSANSETERDEILSALGNWSRGVYGTKAGADPYSGYEAKGKVAHFHTIRPIIKDCVPVDDITFPLFIDTSAPDYQVRLQDVDGKEVKGTEVEYTLFCLGTGTEWSLDEFEQAAARVYTLERALQVRHWGRDRSLDETVLPYFDRLESYQNPLFEQRYGLDREQFKPALDEFYTLHGWDPETGWPTKERLEALGLPDVYEPMIAGHKA